MMFILNRLNTTSPWRTLLALLKIAATFIVLYFN